MHALFAAESDQRKGLNLSVGKRLMSCKVKAEDINLEAAMLNVNISVS